MKAIFINSQEQTVTEIDIDGSVESLQQAVGGDFEAAMGFPNGDVLYVDEEGLLKSPAYFFEIGAHQPFAGNGIVTREDDEESAPCKSSVEEIRARTKFLRSTVI